jgi:hypothetical protein
LRQAAQMAMKPPDEAQPADHPYRHDWQIGFARERLAEGEHDEGHGQHAEDKDRNFGAI